MQSNADVYVFSLPAPSPSDLLHFSLIRDEFYGAALVDTGLPGQAALIAAALSGAGVRVADLTNIIVTHHDIDHVGSLHDLVQASRARVLAHAIEAPAIEGTIQPRFATPARLARYPTLHARAERFQPTPVDVPLHDGIRLDWVGGVRVIFTPGRTLGHMCLYLERSRTLIASDTLTARNGQLHGPDPTATQDMALAAQSVQRLAKLDVHAIVCYHGGIVCDDAHRQLRRVAQELAAAALPTP